MKITVHGDKMKRIFVLIVSFMFLGSGIAFAGTFTDSAHGNSSSGVKRKNPFPSEYSRGNCAHCHEQHASIEGDEPTPDANKAQGPDSFCLLANNWSGLPTVKPYVQDDNSCFYCHTSSATFQALPSFFNYSYCRTFGGYSSDATASIMDTFNLTSYHNLYDLYRYITGQSGSGSHPSFTDFPASSSPCSGCHNVHIAKRNKATPGNPSNTAISRPSDHNNLWGDGSPGERMTATGYSADYQPPQYYSSSSNLEPDGTSSDRATQAGKTPDYNTFCIDCHNSTNTIWSTSLSRNLKTINWDVEKHGKGDADGYITVDSPYTSGSGDLGYVLSCLDCHEPHGSSNAFLIRKEVNGAALGATIGYGTDADKLDNANWDYLCNRCHQDDAELHSGCEADNYGEIHHSTTYGGDPPYTTDIQNCGGCHSFTPETPVMMHDNTLKPIGDIREGDRVLSFDFDENEFRTSEVVCVFSRFVEETVNINGVETTSEHSFAVDKGRWVEAGMLKDGDTVLGLTGDTTELEKIQLEKPVFSKHPEKVEVVDITVMSANNFFVLGRQDMFLVHNQEGYSCTSNQAQTTCTNCHYHGSEWSGRPTF